MIWLKSTTQKTWTINGKVIPACITPHNDYLAISDEEYSVVKTIPVVSSLIKAGGILVLKEEPAELKNSMDNLQTSVATLQAKNTVLEQEIKELKTIKAIEKQEIDAIKASAQEEIKAEAVKEIAEKQAALEAAEAEIKSLKKKLKEATKAESEE